MSTFPTTAPILYLILFVLCVSLVIPYDAGAEELESSFGEKLFLSLFGLDDTLPCDLCGDNTGTNKLYHGERPVSKILPIDRGGHIPVFDEINDWLKSAYLIFCSCDWLLDARDLFVTVNDWLCQKLGFVPYIGITVFVIATVLRILVSVVSKSKAYPEKESLKEYTEIRQSKRRKTIPESSEQKKPSTETQKHSSTRENGQSEKVDTNVKTKQDHGTELMKLAEICVNALKQSFSSTGKTSENEKRKAVRKHDSMRKVQKHNLKRSKPQKPVHVLMKKMKASTSDEKFGKGDEINDDIATRLRYVGLGCLGLKSSDFYAKQRTPVKVKILDEFRSSLGYKDWNQTETEPSSIGEIPINAADDIDGSYELAEEPADLDVSDDLGPPCASSSTIGLYQNSSDGEEPEYLDVSDDSALVMASEAKTIYGIIPRPIYSWLQRINWRHYRRYVEMPWLNSFTENSFFDSSFTQDSMNLSDIQNNSHMYGEDMESIYQLFTLWMVKAAIDKAKTLFIINKSHNCSNDFHLSSDDSTEL